MTQDCEIPKTKAERDKWYGSSPLITDDIVRELSIQCKGYLYLGFSFKAAQEKSLNALREFGSERAFAVPITEEMLAVEDYRFRLKEKIK